MAKITYNMGNSGAETTSACGVRFEDGKPVDTMHAALLDMARSNPFFEVTDDDPDEPENETPFERGAAAHAAGKKRSVPPAYRGKNEGDNWLEGYDSYAPSI